MEAAVVSDCHSVNRCSSIVSLVSSARGRKLSHERIESVIAGIREGRWEDQVKLVRDAFKAEGKKSASIHKQNLPAIMFSGDFKHRSANGLKEYSGLICADVDNCSGILNEIKNAAKGDKFLRAAFVSPTGSGIKLLFETDATESNHLSGFIAVAKHCREKYSIEIDKACKDISRLCFVSFDPELIFNPDSKRLSISEDDSCGPHSEIPPIAQEIPEKSSMKLKVLSALDCIASDDYDLWRDIGFALHDWNKNEGLEIFDDWSKTSDHYTPGGCEKLWASIKSKGAKHNRITIRTLFYHARAHGWSGSAKDTRSIVSNYYFGDRTYWRPSGSGGYVSINTEQIKRELRVNHALSLFSKDGMPSEVDTVLNQIEHDQFIHGVAPFIFNPKEFVFHEGRRYLNSSLIKPVRPSDSLGEWGQGFEFIANLIDDQFDSFAREHLIHWMAHLYQTALKGRLEKGTALIIVGAPKRGKTLLSNKVIGGLVGGCVDASEYLLGESKFNSEMFEKAIWAIDDSLGAASLRHRMQFTNRMKKTVANHQFKSEAKFRTPVTLPWCGRIIITANEDPDSLRILPNMDMTISDKISLLKIRKDAQAVEATNAGDLVDEQLPALAAWLSAFLIPNEVKDGRFGIKAFHDPLLLEVAVDGSPAARFREIFDLWRHKGLSWRDDEKCVCMNATEVLNSMKDHQLSPVHHSVGGWKEITLGGKLTALAITEPSWLAKTKIGGKVCYRICRPKGLQHSQPWNVQHNHH